MKSLKICSLTSLGLLSACSGVEPSDLIESQTAPTSNVETQDQSAVAKKINFDLDLAKSVIVKGITFYFKGTVSKDVSRVEILVDDWSLGDSDIELKDGKYQFMIAYQFAAAGQNRKLVARAFDSKNKKIDQYQYAVNVLENSPSEENNSETIAQNDQFDLAEPEQAEIVKTLDLWATYYTLHKAASKENGIALRDLKNVALGPKLSTKDWCYAAMEGSVYIKDPDGEANVYNYAGTTDKYTVDCSSVFNHPASGKVKFRLAKGKFGDGVRSYALAPLRTIATDPSVIPYGTVIYIPKARGTVINLSNGYSIIHDGYFFAGDTGGLIKKSHIDVFIGPIDNNPFVLWIKSNNKWTFKAYVVKSNITLEHMKLVHTAP